MEHAFLQLGTLEHLLSLAGLKGTFKIVLGNGEHFRTLNQEYFSISLLSILFYLSHSKSSGL